MKKIDINKKYRTRDGREVTKLQYDGQMPFPYLGNVDGVTYGWTPEGRYNSEEESPLDLIEVESEPDPPKPIQDGGSAFPKDMSLRDWFAGMAMQGYCARPDLEKECQQGFAIAAYDQADAMLAEREKGGAE